MADQVMATPGTTFVPVPEGDYQAVCCDIIDLGLVESQKWKKMQHKVAIGFQLDAAGEDLQQYVIFERFTVSMNEKAQLRKFLEQWRGRPYKEEQIIDGVPLHKLEGQNALISVVHKQAGDRVYANIFKIGSIGKNDKPMAVVGYTRSPKWAEKIKQSVASHDEPLPGAEDATDDLPF